MLVLPGAAAHSHFRLAKLRDALQALDPRVAALGAQFQHFIDLARPLAPAERERLAQYVERFNARDFERLRDMLADDVRLDLVGRKVLRGRELVGNYFSNYAKATDWCMTIGLVEGQAAAFVSDPLRGDAGPQYFILLDWSGDELKAIRDFRYARYVLDGAELAFV